MCMLIISDRWKNEGVCMWLLRYMRDTFLELDTSLNDELVRGKINKSVSLHTVILLSMMSQSEERSISLYPFKLSGYPTKIHSVLCGSSAFLFLEGIWVHAREPKI
jgi:hypothetical protein